MTDWAAPGQGDTKPTAPPRYGELAPPGYIPPHLHAQPGGTASPAPPPGSWTPPPKPGLIPLRPLGLGDILGAAFNVVRRNPRPTFGFALLMSLATTLIVGGVTGGVTVAMLSRIDNASLADQELIASGSILTIAITVLISALVSSALLALAQGIISLEVAKGAIGERHGFRSLWRSAKGRLWALIGWTVLISAVLVLVLAVIGGVFILLSSLGAAGVVTGILLGLVLGLGSSVLVIWLTTKLGLVPAVLMVERVRLREAMRRSWQLTAMHWWRVFGITLLINVIVQVAAQIITTPISLLGGLFSVLINPNGDVDASIGALILVTVITSIVTIVVTAVALVAQSAVPALLYLDLRIRKEGLDIRLQQHVEHPGDSDPYRVD